MDSKNVILLTVKPPLKSFVPVKDKRIPLKIATLMTYLLDSGAKVSFIDNYLKHNDWEEDVNQPGVDFVCVYLSLTCWGNAKSYLETLQAMRPDGSEKPFKIIVFGPQATFNTELVPDYVDHVITGEPYNAMADVISGKIKDRIVEAEPVDNPDTLKQPQWNYFIPNNNALDSDYDFTDLSLGDTYPVFDLITVCGIQHKLAYCPAAAMPEVPLKFMSASKIVKKVEYLVDNFGAKGIRFLDYNFAADKERLLELCSEIFKNDLSIDWKCNIKPGSVDKSTLSMMKKAGCKVISVPVESGNPDILRHINADFTLNQVEELFSLAKSTGLKIIANVTYGWPTETESEVSLTENFIEKCEPDFTNINIFAGKPKSKLYEEAMNYPHRIDENGMVIPYKWDSIADKYLGISSYSGNYLDVPLASNPLPRVVFYKKHQYIEDRVNYLDSLPLNKKIYFYGAGKLAKSFIKKYKMEESNIKGVFDGDLTKSGRFRPTKFTIYHETEVKKLVPDYIFITMASREDSIKVKEAIMNNIDIDKKPEICSMFFEEV